jgi:hypothetical protein
MPIYTVVAHRWGWLNEHHYQVGVTQDADRAITLAEAERDDRGGKYGVVVLEWSDETTCKQYAYYGSVYGEQALHHNPRIDMFEGIGHDIHSAVTTGLLWVAAEDGTVSSKPMVADAPDWVVDSVRKRERTSIFSTKLQLDREARQKAGLPLQPLARDDAQSKAWLDQLSAEVDAEVEALISAVPQKRVQTMAAYQERQTQRQGKTQAHVKDLRTAELDQPTES